MDKRIIGSVITALLILLLVAGYLYSNRKTGDNSNQIADAGSETGGEEKIEETKEKKIDKETLKNLKDSMGNLDIDKSSSSKDKHIDLHRPGIDWSGGELNTHQLTLMVNTACALYEETLNKKSVRYMVQGTFPAPEEVTKFKMPVFYFVEDGALTLNLKLTVFDLEEETQKDVFKPLTVRYELDVAKLAG